MKQYFQFLKPTQYVSAHPVHFPKRLAVICLLGILLCTSFLSCTSYKAGSASPVAINAGLDNFSNFCDVSDKLSISSVIALEHNDRCIIEDIEKIKSDSNFYYILDGMNLRNIVVFRKDGAFVENVFTEEFKLENIFFKISDFDVYNATVYASNNATGELYIKDMNTKKFRTLLFPTSFLSFKFLARDTIIVRTGYNDLSEGRKGKYAVYDISGEQPVLVRKLLPYKKPGKASIGEAQTHNGFASVEEGYLVHEVGNDTLYLLSNDGSSMKPKYIIDFGGTTTRNLWKIPAYRKSVLNYHQETGTPITGWDLFRLGDLLLINYFDRKFDRNFLYNMATGETVCTFDDLQLKSEGLPVPFLLVPGWANYEPGCWIFKNG